MRNDTKVIKYPRRRKKTTNTQFQEGEKMRNLKNNCKENISFEKGCENQ